MIALKREVAAGDQQVFRGANVKLGNWRQVTVRNYYNSHCDVVTTCGFSRHTRESVQSPLVVQKAITSLVKVRKGGDFFYGKSSNENHFKGV